MIIVDCEQNSPEWCSAKVGVPSTSGFGKILTPTGKDSTQIDKYANELTAEWLAGKFFKTFQSDWMSRGHDIEAEARNYYAMQADADPVQVGFVLRDDGLVGSSPDSLIADDGLNEIKCPKHTTHVEYLLKNELPLIYKPQTQGQLYICEREWVDFLSYHPDMPEQLLIRVYRDEPYIARLIRRIATLHELMDERKAKLIERDITPMEQAA